MRRLVTAVEEMLIEALTDVDDDEIWEHMEADLDERGRMLAHLPDMRRLARAGATPGQAHRLGGDSWLVAALERAWVRVGESERAENEASAEVTV